MTSANMKYLLPAVCALLLGCMDDRCAPMPDGGRYCLQPSTAVTTYSVQQKVDASFGKVRETMIAGIETDAQGMQFIGLTPFGQKFLHLRFDNQTVQVLQSPSDKLPPALLLATLQAALWPTKAVQRGFGPRYEVKEIPGGREISSETGLLMRIEHDDTPAPYRRLRVIMPAVELQLDMQSLDTL